MDRLPLLSNPLDPLAALEAIVDKINTYDDKMGDAANDGRSAQPPDGDDYNELYSIVMTIGLPALVAAKTRST